MMYITHIVKDYNVEIPLLMISFPHPVVRYVLKVKLIINTLQKYVLVNILVHMLVMMQVIDI